MQRRDAVATLLGAVASLFSAAGIRAHERLRPPDFAAIERRVSGRLGVAVLNVNSGRRLAYRAGTLPHVQHLQVAARRAGAFTR